MSEVWAAVFAGGHGQRMGGADKGRLRLSADGPNLMEHWASLLDRSRIERVAVVRARQNYPNWKLIEDAAQDVGPLGGLVAALRFARSKWLCTFACDMPYVSQELLGKLIQRTTDASQSVLAPRSKSGKWEPLFAAYRCDACLGVAEEHLRSRNLSLQSLLRALGVEELLLSASEQDQLRDWDTPQDVLLGD